MNQANLSARRKTLFVIEPIDFSGQEGEYLSADLKQKAVAFSIIWAIVGALFSGFFFLRKPKGPASQLLDRRQAEGRVVHPRSNRSDSQAYASFSAQAPSVRPYRRKPSNEEDPWSTLAAVDTPKSRATPTAIKENPTAKLPPAPRVLTAKLPAPRHTAPPVVKRAAPVTLPPSKKSPPPEAIDRLLYPIISERPDRTNLTSAAGKGQQSLIRLANLEGQYHLGVIIDPSGRALISDALLQDGSLNRVWYNGTQVRAEVVARDPEYGLALIRLPSGQYPALPLAPGPPARGERLVAFGPTTNASVSTQVRAGLGFAAAGFMVEGHLGTGTWGTPLLNDRGELVGVQISSLPNFPGSGIHLAADSSVIYRMSRGYDSGNRAAFDQTQRAVYARLTSLAIASRGQDRQKKGRVIANVGVSQFYLGMDKQEASRWVPSAKKFTTSPGVENWKNSAPPLELVFVNEYLVAVATDYSGFSTETGISMGARIDSRYLSRYFDNFLLLDGLALVPGLDIVINSDGKARQFVVRPAL